jgi:polysaccharide pyruvyl transferase WcaK-like protein
MTRVLLKGYYGFRNTGDDALCAASAWGARSAFGAGAALTMVGSTVPTFPGSERVTPAFRSAGRWRGEARIRTWVAAFRARAVLFGGGSVFHTAARLREVERLLRISGPGPHLAAGVSIGPLRSVADERACAGVLRRLAFLGLRDRESAEIAAALAPNVPSRLTFDLAPLLLALDERAARPPAARRGLGVAICDYERFTGGDLRRETLRRARVADLLRALDRELVDEIVFLDFNGHPDNGDAGVHGELRARIADRGIPVRTVPYDPSPLAVLEAVASLRAIVAMRLHAAVFGYLARTPTVILAYHPKCRGWAEQAGVAPSMVHDSVEFDPAEVARAVSEALLGRAPPPSLPVPVAVERARLNFPSMAV